MSGFFCLSGYMCEKNHLGILWGWGQQVRVVMWLNYCLYWCAVFPRHQESRLNFTQSKASGKLETNSCAQDRLSCPSKGTNTFFIDAPVKCQSLSGWAHHILLQAKLQELSTPQVWPEHARLSQGCAIGAELCTNSCILLRKHVVLVHAACVRHAYFGHATFR